MKWAAERKDIAGITPDNYQHLPPSNGSYTHLVKDELACIPVTRDLF
jgi:hypothetical protein